MDRPRTPGRAVAACLLAGAVAALVVALGEPAAAEVIDFNDAGDFDDHFLPADEASSGYTHDLGAVGLSGTGGLLPTANPSVETLATSSFPMNAGGASIALSLYFRYDADARTGTDAPWVVRLGMVTNTTQQDFGDDTVFADIDEVDAGVANDRSDNVHRLSLTSKTGSAGAADFDADTFTLADEQWYALQLIIRRQGISNSFDLETQLFTSDADGAVTGRVDAFEALSVLNSTLPIPQTYAALKGRRDAGAVVLDDLRVGEPALVPEPASLVLLLCGVGLLSRRVHRAGRATR